MKAKLCKLILYVLLCASPCVVQADTVRVAVASNFSTVLEKLARIFEADTGHVVLSSPGSTGRHYTQIVNGAPFDLFLAADQERPQLLEQQDRIVPGTRITYATGRLVLWSPDARLVDPEGLILQSGNFRHLAIANPRLAPYGKAAQQALESMALWEKLMAKLVQGENISQTLQFVASGNAELGFIAYSQWLEMTENPGGSTWLVPPELHEPVAQQAVLLQDKPAARDFLRFLQSDTAMDLIAATGYGLP